MDNDGFIKIYENYKLGCSGLLERSMLYHEYDQKYIQDSHKELRKELEIELNEIDFREFTKDILVKEFNFGKWDEDLILCPLWTIGLIKVGTELYTIGDRLVVYGKDDLSNDSRFGYLGYGFRTSDLRDYRLKNLTE